MFTKVLLVLLSLAIPALAAHNSPKAYTPYGIMVGYHKVSQGGRKYKVFEGIRYAKPPEGDLRFEEPIYLNPSNFMRNRTVDATKKGDVCAQYADVPPSKTGQPVTKGQIVGSDDCLYVNIYVPVLDNPSKRMPVIFFIHGGAFQYASGNMFGDMALADRDVVFVTVNYRLGISGFLSTEDEVLPGNLGLKDQSVALRWVSRNIQYFGGDPSKIILVGFSAGSSSIQYHYLSPWSRGLFHGSIAMSGTAFNTWAFSEKGSAEKARKLGAIFNCPTNSSRMMIDCLKKVPALTLADAEKEFQYWQYNPEAPFQPVAEKAGARPFINKSPWEILDAKEIYDVPAVYGAVSQEGCSPAAEYAPHDNLLKQLNDDWINIAPEFFECTFTMTKEQQNEVAMASRQKYFGNKTIDKETVPQLIKLLTDQNYFIGFEDGIRLQARASKSPVYFYYYSFRSTRSYSEHLSRTTNNYGVCHTDDMNLVLDALDNTPPITKKDLDMQKFLTDMWVSVAYKGVPDLGVEWDPVDPSDPKLKFLHIYEPGKYKMSGCSNFGHKNFWSKFFFTV